MQNRDVSNRIVPNSTDLGIDKAMSISTKDAAAKLDVSERRVRVLCQQGRIKGAELIGGSWILPDNPVITAGTRTRPGKIQVKTKGKK